MAKNKNKNAPTAPAVVTPTPTLPVVPENAPPVSNTVLEVMYQAEAEDIVPPIPMLPGGVPALPPSHPAMAQFLQLVPEGTSTKRYQSKTDPNSKYHLRDRSNCAKPVDVVRGICNANATLTRKEIIKLCLQVGVNKHTAATQYSLWRSALNKTQAAAAEAETEETEETE